MNAITPAAISIAVAAFLRLPRSLVLAILSAAGPSAGTVSPAALRPWAGCGQSRRAAATSSRASCGCSDREAGQERFGISAARRGDPALPPISATSTPMECAARSRAKADRAGVLMRQGLYDRASYEVVSSRGGARTRRVAAPDSVAGIRVAAGEVEVKVSRSRPRHSSFRSSSTWLLIALFARTPRSLLPCHAHLAAAAPPRGAHRLARWLLDGQPPPPPSAPGSTSSSRRVPVTVAISTPAPDPLAACNKSVLTHALDGRGLVSPFVPIWTSTLDSM